MDGKSRMLQQITSGVRLFVQELDELRSRYGVGSVKVLTPKAEVFLRIIMITIMCSYPIELYLYRYVFVQVLNRKSLYDMKLFYRMLYALSN
jgi:hypothetical protein